MNALVEPCGRAGREALTDAPAASPPCGSTPDDRFDHLRDILFGKERADLERLRQRVEEPQLRADDVSRVLAQAVVTGSAEGPALAAALAPSVEAALASSIQRDPQVMADALFPVMGPAIRKAIAAALQGMTQSLEQTLSHSFSPQGLKWRLEAARTGRPFAEVVMLHTLLYRVEQVFLIDRRAGLLLQHVAAANVVVQDTDMVSGMLTAIQDFVRDSFKTANRESLDTLQVGGLVVWIEQGPQAILAGVIRGTPPQTVRERFRRAIENVHLQHGEALEAFDGDPAALEAARPELEGCLEASYGKAAADADGEPQRRGMAPLAIIAGVLGVALATLLFLHFRQASRWDGYVARLRSEPGLLITEAVKRNGKYHVAGLRDPLAADPLALLAQAELDAGGLQFSWEPYLSLRPDLVARRAAAALAPPAGVQLHVEGQALRAEGVAPRAWLQTARQTARGLPGIGSFDASGVVIAEDREWPALRHSIEAHVLRTREGGSTLLPGQDEALAQLTAELQRLDALASSSGVRARVEIIGHTDSQGTEGSLLRLSRARAGEVLRLLGQSQLAHVDLLPRGVGASDPLRPELTARDREVNRRTSFKAHWPVAAERPETTTP